MIILFVGENLNISKSGVKTVMNQILHDPSLKAEINYKVIFTTSDNHSTLKKLLGWSKAYIKFMFYLPSCEIVHIHHASDLNFWLSAGMVWVAKKFGKKTILHNHAADFHEFYNRSSDTAKGRIKMVFTLATGNIVLSNSWMEWYSALEPGANWFMLQNAIEVPDNIPPKTLNSGQINLLYLARLEQRKGFFDLLNVMPAIVNLFPNIHLFIAGHGDVEKAKAIVIEKQIEKNVEILGHIDKKQRDIFLKLSHILVFPSYNEGLPMSLLEAMSYRMVPITTPVGGIPDVVVSGYNGLLIAPGDTEALIEKLSTLLNDTLLYNTLSENAFASINKDFNYNNYGAKLKNIYSAVLGRDVINIAD